jgi:hypothetical protein
MFARDLHFVFNLKVIIICSDDRRAENRREPPRVCAPI